VTAAARLAIGACAALLAPAAAWPSASECTGRLSGAVTATFECDAGVTATEEGKLVFVLVARAPIDGVPSCVPGAFEIPEAVARTWTLDTLGMGKASVAAEGGTLYTATKTSSQRGEVTLAITRLRKRSAHGAYDVSGRYRARLVPAGGGKTGDVLVEATFGGLTRGKR
jgi:hypothetical protein